MSDDRPGDGRWAAVLDPTRQQLLNALLRDGSSTATALAAELPVTRQAVAKHLAVLEGAGLVEVRRQGREARYAVREDALAEVAGRLARLAADWDRSLAEIKLRAETAARTRPTPGPSPDQGD